MRHVLPLLLFLAGTILPETSLANEPMPVSDDAANWPGLFYVLYGAGVFAFVLILMAEMKKPDDII